MKGKFSFFKKIAALFLATCFFVLSGISLICVVYDVEFEYYTSTQKQIRHEMLLNKLADETWRVYQKFIADKDPVGYYEETNFRFEIKDEYGNLKAKNLAADDIIMESVTYEYIETITPPAGEDISYTYHVYTVTGSMVTKGTDIFSLPLGFVSFMYSMRFVFIGLLAIFLLLISLCIFYLIWAAGKHPGEEKPVCGAIEKIPFDLYLFLYFLFTLIAALILQTADTTFLLLTVGGSLSMIAFPLFVSFLMSLFVRIQTGTLWKNTLIYILFSFLCLKTRRFFRILPLIWKAVLVCVGYILIDLFLYMISSDDLGYLIIMIFKYILVLPLIAYIVYQFRKLQKGAEQIKNGGFTSKIDTEQMHLEFRTFGETLNTISDGLGKAVDDRMKSERMKTELITNVSHDIKTPLTSIINYSDLLKQEHIENERAKEYIEVIDRQASRLKKLITDLVEASKASTGNIQVNPERCDIAVLLEQAAGEYDEKLKCAELFPVLRIPNEPLYIYADGRLLWRVFDNLLGNICKYSLPGTRVYLSADAYDSVCLISFKNISRTELNISPEELVERFVRADSSRSTEGNGLGLSIAQSLIDLQGGQMEITADGDLFKINLQFPMMEEESDAE